MAEDYITKYPDCCLVLNAEDWDTELYGDFSEFDERLVPRTKQDRMHGSSNKIVWVKDFISSPEEDQSLKGFVTNCGKSDYEKLY